VNVTFEIKGYREVDDVMRQVQVGAVRITQEELERAAEAVATEARRLAPKRTGALRRSIRAHHQRRFPGLKLRELEAAAGTDMWYAHMVEWGTAPHKLRKGAQRPHPGARAKPFMRPAVDIVLPRLPGRLESALGRFLMRLGL